MEEALLALIRADGTVTGLLGARINWVRRPQADTVFPACTLQRVGGNRKYHTKAPDGLVQSRVQVDVWAKTYGATKTALRAIQSSVDGYRSGIFQGIFIDSERDFPDEINDANIRLFRVSTDLTIWHTE